MMKSACAGTGGCQRRHLEVRERSQAELTQRLPLSVSRGIRLQGLRHFCASQSGHIFSRFIIVHWTQPTHRSRRGLLYASATYSNVVKLTIRLCLGCANCANRLRDPFQRPPPTSAHNIGTRSRYVVHHKG